MNRKNASPALADAAAPCAANSFARNAITPLPVRQLAYASFGQGADGAKENRQAKDEADKADHAGQRHWEP